MEIQRYVDRYYKYLLAHKDEKEALAQEKYMRHRFSFLGLKKPLRNTLHKEFESIHGPLPKKDSLAMAKACMDYPEREMWYTALRYLDRYQSLWTAADLPFLKELIIRGDWWDIVDLVASRHIGMLCLKETSSKIEVQSWIFEDNLWLRRTAILYQLKYKKDTDVTFLSQAILQCVHEKEFFIQKAIGWALREYAKSNPEFVRNFISFHHAKMSNLSLREASKYL